MTINRPIGMAIMKFFMNRSLVHAAAGSFSRRLFYRHDEIEYGVIIINPSLLLFFLCLFSSLDSS